MKINRQHFYNNEWNKDLEDETFNNDKCQLVFVFGANALVTRKNLFNDVRNLYPTADIVGCSTSGEITSNNVYDNSMLVTAIQFENTKTECAQTNINEHTDSFEAGKYLIEQLHKVPDTLISIFVISDGTKINAGEFVRGLNAGNKNKVPITGGLAGDAANFISTSTGLNELPTEGNIIAVGFYGKSLKVGYGSFGGWEEFGKERTITKSCKNIVYEIDGVNALGLYKEYLGPYAADLPGSALLFPLSFKEESGKTLVRTILSINEYDKSVTFTGNLPEGSKIRLMKASFNNLIKGPSMAAKHSLIKDTTKEVELALVISCVGRKLILGDRSYEGVVAVRKELGTKTVMSGFYSYGEISPVNESKECELLNQTVTIVTFLETL